MKKVLLVAVVVFAPLLLSQTMDVVFTEEGVQSVIDNTVFVIEEPTVSLLTSSRVISQEQRSDQESQEQPDEQEETSEFELTVDQNAIGASVGAEMNAGKNSKVLNIPLRLRWRQYTFGANVPYLYSKRFKFSMEDIETSGIGDISLSVGYGSSFKGIYYNTDFLVKLPTGDWENFEGGSFAPLGTGSTDFVFSGSGVKFIGSSSVGGSVFYKHNLSSDVLVKIPAGDGTKSGDYDTVKFDITNGNLLVLGASYGYNLRGFTLGTGVTFFKSGEGNTDKDYQYVSAPDNNTTTTASNFQDMTLLDLTPSVSYKLSIFDFSTGVNIPVYSKYNENAKEQDRSVKFFFKFDYKIL